MLTLGLEIELNLLSPISLVHFGLFISSLNIGLSVFRLQVEFIVFIFKVTHIFKVFSKYIHNMHKIHKVLKCWWKSNTNEDWLVIWNKIHECFLKSGLKEETHNMYIINVRALSNVGCQFYNLLTIILQVHFSIEISGWIKRKFLYAFGWRN